MIPKPSILRLINMIFICSPTSERDALFEGSQALLICPSCKSKYNVLPVHTMKAYIGSRAVAPFILNISATWGWVGEWSNSGVYLGEGGGEGTSGAATPGGRAQGAAKLILEKQKCVICTQKMLNFWNKMNKCNFLRFIISVRVAIVLTHPRCQET